jgi:hypothetical protein
MSKFSIATGPALVVTAVAGVVYFWFGVVGPLADQWPRTTETNGLLGLIALAVSLSGLHKTGAAPR